jgi:Domain of unknown function (DUF3854)
MDGHDGSPHLLAHHLEQLTKGSGIAPEVIAARGYRSIHGPGSYSLLKPYGFSRTQAQLNPGILLPVWSTDGASSPVLYVYRPDKPRDIKERLCKYEIPKDAGLRLDCPPRCRPMLGDPTIPLWLTEGQKKADALASHGGCVVDLLSVWAFKGKSAFGATTFLNDWDYIGLEGRDIRIVFDSDVMVNPWVRKALTRLTEHLQRKRGHITEVYLPQDGGKKVGVDDYLLAHTLQDLEGLIERPRPTPVPAKPTVTLLLSPSKMMNRPLQVINGHAYAATWLATQKTITEKLDKRGEVVRLREPEIREEWGLFVIRDDGQLFGDVIDPQVKPLSLLGFTVNLERGIIEESRLWSAIGLVSYRRGKRPTLASLFQKLVEVISFFIDFEQSLAPQLVMCQLVACYIVATWMLEAFTVIGYLWPTGEPGSGKTQLMNIVTELSYLGQTILAGSTYATLRDLADYGATLGFDDAEKVFHPKMGDPDKRNLLLSGNRRGNTIAMKEADAHGTWHIRRINTFCPRLFTATSLPDAILGSRSIVIPLIKTLDRERANCDPLDDSVWPHNRDELKDDLWALALASVRHLPAYVAKVNSHASLIGRDLEPWRPILAVAKWLEAEGIEKLGETMEQLSLAYQHERPDLEEGSLVQLVVVGICRCAMSAINSMSAIKKAGGASERGWIFTTAEITKEVNTAADDVDERTEGEAGEGEAEDADAQKAGTKRHFSFSGKRVGRAMARMRFKQEPRPGGKGSRRWQVPLKDLKRWTERYRMPRPEQLEALITQGDAQESEHEQQKNATEEGAPSPINGTNGANGTHGTQEDTSADVHMPDAMAPKRERLIL